MLSEVGTCGRKVLGLVNKFDDEDGERMREETFRGKQLLAFHVNRYLQEDMLEFINLYLRWRDIYRALKWSSHHFINKISRHFQDISWTKLRNFRTKHRNCVTEYNKKSN